VGTSEKCEKWGQATTFKVDKSGDRLLLLGHVVAFDTSGTKSEKVGTGYYFWGMLLHSGKSKKVGAGHDSLSETGSPEPRAQSPGRMESLQEN
jgi:hypothetical protein